MYYSVVVFTSFMGRLRYAVNRSQALPVRKDTTDKGTTGLITYKAKNNMMADYISDFCIRVADNRLRSSSKNLLQVRRSSTRFGDCSFSISGPTAWNSLPDHVKSALSL